MTTSIESLGSLFTSKKRAAPFPSEPAVEPYGEGYPELPPNIIPSENSFAGEQVLDAQPTSTEDEKTFTGEVPTTAPDELDDASRKIYDLQHREFHTSMLFKVREELVAQLFTTSDPESADIGYINLQAIVEVIAKETKDEKDHSFAQATYLSNSAIPAARNRPSFDPSLKNPSDYLTKDIPVLEAREEAHLAMVSYLEQYQQATDEDRTEFAELFVRTLLPEARKEASAIITQLQYELEEQKRQIDQKIAKLEKKRRTILEGSQHDETRDSEILHNEQVSYLTEQAKGLAQ